MYWWLYTFDFVWSVECTCGAPSPTQLATVKRTTNVGGVYAINTSGIISRGRPGVCASLG